MTVADLETPSPTSEGRPRRGWMLAAAAVMVVGVVAVVFVERGSRQSTVVMTATPAGHDTGARLILLSRGDRVCRCVDHAVGRGDRPRERHEPLSAGRAVRHRSRQPATSSRCASAERVRRASTGWAYVTGSVDSGEVHRGVLGEANAPEVFVLDDRFFVAVETHPILGTRRPPGSSTRCRAGTLS